MSDMYPKGREKLTEIWTTDVFKVVGVSAGYTYDASHQFLSSIPVGNRIATSGALTGKTHINGYCVADDTTLPGNNGDPITKLILFRDTGDASTSDLISYADVNVTPNGIDIIVDFNALGVFAIDS